MAPALNDRPLKRHSGACLNACNSVTKGVRDMGPSVIKSSWPHLSSHYSQQLGVVSNTVKM